MIVGAGIAEEAVCHGLKQDPAFRKATLPMIYACAAFENLKTRYAVLFESDLQSTGLVVGSAQGEMEVTNDYLRGLALSKVARPILFQNSLHHSTLGFLSLRYRIAGPSCTLSDRYLSAETALSYAAMMIEARQTELCFVCALDTFVSGMEEVRSLTYPLGLKRGQGAAVLALMHKDWAREQSLTILADLHAINMGQGNLEEAKAEKDAFSFEPYYDGDALRHLADHLLYSTSRPSTRMQLLFRKPEGPISSILIG